MNRGSNWPKLIRERSILVVRIARFRPLRKPISLVELLQFLKDLNYCLHTHIVGRPTSIVQTLLTCSSEMCGTIALRPSETPVAGQVLFIFTKTDLVSRSSITHCLSLSISWISSGSQKLIFGHCPFLSLRAGMVGVIVKLVIERLQVVNVNVVALG